MDYSFRNESTKRTRRREEELRAELDSLKLKLSRQVIIISPIKFNSTVTYGIDCQNELFALAYQLPHTLNSIQPYPIIVSPSISPSISPIHASSYLSGPYPIHPSLNLPFPPPVHYMHSYPTPMQNLSHNHELTSTNSITAPQTSGFPHSTRLDTPVARAPATRDSFHPPASPAPLARLGGDSSTQSEFISFLQPDSHEITSPGNDGRSPLRRNYQNFQPVEVGPSSTLR